jgi:hypothetical protein
MLPTMVNGIIEGKAPDGAWLLREYQDSEGVELEHGATATAGMLIALCPVKS